MGSIGTRLFSLAFIFIFTGCANYQRIVSNTHKLIRQGQAHKAADLLKERAYQEGKDQLVFLMEYGTALQLAGDYLESNKVFIYANELIKEKDHHSVSKIASSLALNDGMLQYKGEDFENMNINVQAALNHTMMGDQNSTRIEVRRLEEKLSYFKTEGKKKYLQNSFAHYLAALTWEQSGDWDSAYIHYMKIYEDYPGTAGLADDLLRAAVRRGNRQNVKEWSKKSKLTEAQIRKQRKMAEVVLLFEQGWIPRKRPNPRFKSLPKLYPTPSTTKQASLKIGGYSEVRTHIVYDLESVAISTLGEKYGAMVAKKIAAIATKEILSDQVRQKDEGLGALTNLLLHISDQADLRQWSTLPETYQATKMWIQPGTYTVKVTGLTAAGFPSGELKNIESFEVKAGTKNILHWRSLQ